MVTVVSTVGRLTPVTLNARRGYDFATTITVTDAAGAPRNLTGLTAHLRAKASSYLPDVLIDLPGVDDTGGTITIPAPATGVVAVYIPASVTAGWEWSHAVFSLWTTHSGDPHPRLVSHGRISVARDAK